MANSEKLVVYYSCFNYEIDPVEFPQLHGIKQTLLMNLGEEWKEAFQRELEFMNIRQSNHCMEFAIEVYIRCLKQVMCLDYSIFKQIFIEELNLKTIWIENNKDCHYLDSLLNAFFNTIVNIQIELDLSNYEFKLLSSAKHLSQLQPLVVAQEVVETFASKVYKVLRRASFPLEAIIRPESLESLSRYIQSLSNKVLSTFQVTSQFVTNIVEVNPFNQDIKIRVIQPARDFYDKAIDVWMSLGDHMTPTSFVLCVKQRLGPVWTEKLLNPSLHFYEIASEEWLKSKEYGVDCFMRSLQARLWEVWRQSIVETSKNFQEHMIPKTII
ncbi:unnamed protein product [Blepharisma stoltei]|uniref:Uncharacterized protein n=1 Tax=Blepharisma stoltei TaxID=1481888 RepID=A0AAU9I9J7_9CILI|nr:unnamed protein product [Blepharisma stoltei]